VKYGRDERRKWRNSLQTSRKNKCITVFEKKKQKENVNIKKHNEV
jgi:hypothetical protein